MTLFDLSNELAGPAGCDVDLLDFRAASTVMQSQILLTGARWWHKDDTVALYDAALLSDKPALDQARQALLDDILERGSVYGQ